MVRFKPNIVVSDVFGSAGDVTAHHREGKTFLRQRVAGRNGRDFSPAQLEHLAVHCRALAAWRGLPHQVQEEWNGYAREVEPHRPPFDHSSWISGQNLFVSAYHGFHTLGMEHVPEPCRFEAFPAFAVEAVSAFVENGTLWLRLSVAGLESVEDASRYWLYGQLQLAAPGQGASSRLTKRSVLAEGSCLSGMPVEIEVEDYVSVFGLDLPAYQVHGRFVLLDAVTGYRSQRIKSSFEVELSNR